MTGFQLRHDWDLCERPLGICRCLGGELWYLQHSCVGDAMVYRSGSDIAFYHPAPHSLVTHGHLTLTPQCTLWCARDAPENLSEILRTVSSD